MSRVPFTKAINWNKVDDPKDLEVWNRLVANFWLPEKVPVSNDLPSWNKMTDEEKELTVRVFTGLTMLDTIQGRFGATELMKDAVTLHEEAVYGNINFMEALSKEHDLLTPNGWKNISEIQKGEKVMQYLPECNGMEFAPVINTSHHYNNEVYRIASNNNSINMVVSGGHRTYYEEKLIKDNKCKDWKGTTVEAREILNVNLKSSHRRFRNTGEVISNGDSLSAKDKLFIAIQADGSFSKVKNPDGDYRRSGIKTGTIPVYMSLTKKRKKDRIIELMAELNLHYTTHNYGNNSDKIYYRIYLPKDWVNGRDKHFTDWFTLENKSLEWCRDFISEVGLWDGHTHKTFNTVTYYSTVQENADFVMAVSAMAGYRCRKMISVDERSDTYNDVYIIHVTRNRNTVNTQCMSITREEPQEVYCVEVPSTYILTRNGESTAITGNCVHAKSYSNIFSTLCSTQMIDDAFRWSEENEHLQTKATIVLDLYHGDDPLKKKIASVFLESFLFYSGFYLPLYLASRSKLTNTADMIRLIIRDECMTDDHELLTPNGWKNISEITEEDMVAQYDGDSEEISFTNPIKVSTHVADYTWEFTDGHLVKQSVSPRHRMLLNDENNAPNVVEADDIDDVYLSSSYTFKCAGNGVGDGTDMTETEKQQLKDGKFILKPLDQVSQQWADTYIDIINTHFSDVEYDIDTGGYTHAVLALTTTPDKILNGIDCGKKVNEKTVDASTVSKTKGESRRVYGVQVPSTFLLTRNNGSVSITGNSIHGYYVGYKFQEALKQKTDEEKSEIQTFAHELLKKLHDNENHYTESLYDELGMTEDVKKFLNYNADKALSNLGFEPMFTKAQKDVKPSILNSLSSVSDENHDFFSGSGSSYVIGKAEATDDDDWDF